MANDTEYKNYFKKLNIKFDVSTTSLPIVETKIIRIINIITKRINVHQ